MAATGLDVFDKTLHTTNLWLDEISEEIGPDRQLAWHVLGTVLRAIRDEMQVEQSAHFAAQLPLLIRGAYFDQYRPAAQPATARSYRDFIGGIRDGLGAARPVNPEQAAVAVMRTLNRHVTEGQIRKVREALPRGVRAIWPEPGHDAGQTRQAAGSPLARQQTAPLSPAGQRWEDTAETEIGEADAEAEEAAAFFARSSSPPQAPVGTANRPGPASKMDAAPAGGTTPPGRKPTARRGGGSDDG